MRIQQTLSRCVLVTALILCLATLGYAAKGGGGNGGGKPGGEEPTPATDPDIVCVVDTDYDGINSGYLSVLNADGSGKTQIHGGFVIGRPDWSPDGQRVLFGGSDLNGTGGVMSIARDGTDLRVVVATNQIPFKVAWSPKPLVIGGQRKIAFEDSLDHDGDGLLEDIDIFIANEDGTDVVNVTNTPDLVERHPVWSKDGNRLAFARAIASVATEQDIIVADLSYVNGALESLETNLTSDLVGGPLSGVPVSQPDWARTQDLLVVTAKDAEGTWSQLWLIDPAEPAGAWSLTAAHDDGQWMKQPSWSWDDKKVIYQGSNDQYPTGSLWTITSDGLLKDEVVRREGKFRKRAYPDNHSMPIWRRLPASAP